jgi:DNA replication protein DnaC
MAQADCPQCSGTGWRLVPADGPDSSARVAVRCECSAPDRKSRLLERARIPEQFMKCDFDGFAADLQYENEPNADRWRKNMQQAKLKVQGFAHEYPVGVQNGLLLMGTCGVGKTLLAVAALKEICLRGFNGLFYDYRELLKEIQASYNAVSQCSEMDVLEPVLTADVLLLDDLGSSKPSDWALETVGHILNSRYNSKRTTLITTNFLDSEVSVPDRIKFPSGQVVPVQIDTLTDRVGQRIRSRLYEMCQTIEMIAPDFRKLVSQDERLRS